MSVGTREGASEEVISEGISDGASDGTSDGTSESTDVGVSSDSSIGRDGEDVGGCRLSTLDPASTLTFHTVNATRMNAFRQ